MHSISVVIPAWNCAPYLTEALASVAIQRRPPSEVLVIDDASTDGSADIARALGARVIQLERNSGPSVARNAGIWAARGDLIAFLDGDDWWEPNHLELVAGLLDRFSGVGVAFGRSNRRSTRHAAPQPPAEQPFDALAPLCRSNPIPQSAAVVRRDLLIAVDGYRADMRYAEDYDLWLRLGYRTRFACTHERTLNYRTHNAQLSRNEARMVAAAWAARARVWRLACAEMTPTERYRIAAELAAGWEAELRMAWHVRGPEPLATLLAQHALVPESDVIRRRWARRARWLRPIWLLAARGWDRLPNRVRRLVRGVPAAPAIGPIMGLRVAAVATEQGDK